MTPPESEALVAAVAIALAAAIAETNRGTLSFRVGVLLPTAAVLAVLAAVVHLLARFS